MWAFSSRLFVFLWAAALIFSGLGPFYGGDGFFTNLPSLVSVVAGLVVLLWQGSMRVVGLSAALFLLSFVVQMPVNPNHRWILFFVALTVLVKWRFVKDVGELANHTHASLRWLTVVVYFFATLAKLNSAYFDTDVSCASIFGRQTLELYGLQVSSSAPLSFLFASGTVVVEALLPLALIWPRTRAYAVFAGVLFHIGLSLHFVRYFANFSTVMFVLLSSWLPESSSKRICDSVKGRLLAGSRVWFVGLVILLTIACLDLVSLVEYGIVRYILYLLYALTLATLVGRGVRGVDCPAGVGRAVYLILALALLTGGAPYLGLKNRSAFTMYSNLRIEPNFSNHFFMPASADLFGYLSDTVQVTETSDPKLKERMQRSSAVMTYLSLCAYLACQDDLCADGNRLSTISYYRHGEPFTHSTAEGLPYDCPPWIARKALFYGPLGPGTEQACLW